MDAQGARWSVQLWEDEDGCWHWDVRSPGLRSTGQRETWREACDTAQAEMTELRAAAEEASGGLRGPGVLVRHLQGDR